MTEKEISDILNIPFDKVIKYCQDRELLLALLALTYHKGIGEGLKQGHDDMNEIFRTYTVGGIQN